MKRIFTIVVCFAIAFSLLAVAPVEEFKAKAVKARQEYIKVKIKHEAAEKQYAALAKEIDVLKAKKPGFFRDMNLERALKKGNRAAFIIQGTDERIKELKEDYFTFSSLVVEEYNRLIYECAEQKCASLQKLFSERDPWSREVKSDELMVVEAPKMEPLDKKNKEGIKDAQAFLEKTVVACEQRIYILYEEKQLLDAVKKAGIKVSDSEYEELSLKSKSLGETRAAVRKMQETLK